MMYPMNPFASSTKYLLLIAAIVACTQVSAQMECGFDARHQQLMLTDPDYQQRVADFNDHAERFDVLLELPEMRP